MIFVSINLNPVTISLCCLHGSFKSTQFHILLYQAIQWYVNIQSNRKMIEKQSICYKQNRCELVYSDKKINLDIVQLTDDNTTKQNFLLIKTVSIKSKVMDLSLYGKNMDSLVPMQNKWWAKQKCRTKMPISSYKKQLSTLHWLNHFFTFFFLTAGSKMQLWIKVIPNKDSDAIK